MWVLRLISGFQTFLVRVLPAEPSCLPMFIVFVAVVNKILSLASFWTSHCSCIEIPGVDSSFVLSHCIEFFKVPWVFFCVEDLVFLHEQGWYFFSLSNLSEFYLFFLSVASVGLLVCHVQKQYAWKWSPCRNLTLNQARFQLLQWMQCLLWSSTSSGVFYVCWDDDMFLSLVFGILHWFTCDQGKRTGTFFRKIMTNTFLAWAFDRQAASFVYLLISLSFSCAFFHVNKSLLWSSWEKWSLVKGCCAPDLPV